MYECVRVQSIGRLIHTDSPSLAHCCLLAAVSKIAGKANNDNMYTDTRVGARLYVSACVCL